MCIFCKLLAGEIPSYKVYEDDRCLAFLDINPVKPGHTLLIPKEHFEMMTDTPDELVSHLFTVAKLLMIDIKEKLSADFVTLSVVGLDVPHFHIHLIPRKYDDGLRGWPTQQYAAGEAEAIVKKLKTS
jgi:histidine triad (HIT) family protein